MSVTFRVCLLSSFVSFSESPFMIVDVIFDNVFVEPPLPQRVVVVGGRTEASATREVGENMSIRTVHSKLFKSASRMRRLPYTSVLIWCVQSLD